MTRSVTASKPAGWWIDETAPDLTDILPATLDANDFAAWLGPKLGEYRDRLSARYAFDAPSQELEKLKRAHALVMETRKAVASLPLRSRSELQSYCHFNAKAVGSTWDTLERRLRDDLMTVGLLLRKARNDLAST